MREFKKLPQIILWSVGQAWMFCIIWLLRACRNRRCVMWAGMASCSPGPVRSTSSSSKMLSWRTICLLINFLGSRPANNFSEIRALRARHGLWLRRAAHAHRPGNPLPSEHIFLRFLSSRILKKNVFVCWPQFDLIFGLGRARDRPRNTPRGSTNLPGWSWDELEKMFFLYIRPLSDVRFNNSTFCWRVNGFEWFVLVFSKKTWFGT